MAISFESYDRPTSICPFLALISRDFCVQSAGYTALMMASEYGHVDIAATLLARSDIDVNRVSSRVSDAFSMQPRGEDTALLLSCRMGHVDIMRLLLARSDVNINVVNVGVCCWSALGD